MNDLLDKYNGYYKVFDKFVAGRVAFNIQSRSVYLLFLSLLKKKYQSIKIDNLDRALFSNISYKPDFVMVCCYSSNQWSLFQTNVASLLKHKDDSNLPTIYVLSKEGDALHYERLTK